jgi:hypothetical protein
MMDLNHAQLQLNEMHAKIDRKTLAATMMFLNRKIRQVTNGLYLQ